MDGGTHGSHPTDSLPHQSQEDQAPDTARLRLLAGALWTITEEDVDVALCLIFLAQGADAGKPVLDAYACKTCGKRFSSFQALGGHSSSHSDKKPRPPAVVPLVEEEEERAESGGAGRRVHQCSICGAKFASGQGLGGHMRRHSMWHRRMADVRKEKANVELDLNLPAAQEEGEVCPQLPPAMGFSFTFLLSSLVGCHY